MGGIQDQQ